MGAEQIPPGETPYGLLAAMPGGEYRLFIPSCLEMETQATAAGAAVLPESKVRMCRFPDRASLERALRPLVARVRTEGVRLVPAPRG
jgi:hypothetical protein